jgi:uncharacterized protein YbjT (DUF2867 family)
LIYLAGATSFLGQRILQRLIEKGEKVRCLARSMEARRKLESLEQNYPENIEIVSGNLLSSDSLLYGLKGIEKAVYVVRLEYSGYLKNFIEALEKCDVKRALFISSTTVLLPNDTKVKRDKIKSEEYIKNSGLDYTILRPSMIYGAEGDNNFSKMLKFIKRKRFFVIFGSGGNMIQPVYVEDVAKSAASALESNRTIKKIYELAGKYPLKYNEMLKIVRNKSGLSFRVIKLPIEASKFAVNVYKQIMKKSDLDADQIERMKIDKVYPYSDAENDFGYCPLSFEEGIEKEISELKFL